LRLFDHGNDAALGGWMCCFRVVPVAVVTLALLPAPVVAQDGSGPKTRA
jgi:hypothetical protein